MDLQKKTFTKEIAGRKLTLEVSKIAEQANAAVMGRYGDTTVLATVVMEDKDRDMGYMPLMVDYEERFYAAGKILGSRFMRREGRPSNDAILSGRLIDRTLRPLFDKRIRRPIQVVVMVLSYDGENDPDFISLAAASTALSISDIPWNGPVAGARVAKINDEFVINPTNKHDNNEDTYKLDAFFAGTAEHINMIEAACDESAEEDILESARKAHETIKELVEFQKEIVAEVGKQKIELQLRNPSEKLVNSIKKFLAGNLQDAIYAGDKTESSDRLKKVKEELNEALISEGFTEDELADVEMLFEKELDDLVHKNVLNDNRRPDGRKLDEVRDLYSEVGLLPRVHGSAVFIRGKTQALAVTTLAAPGSEQLIEGIEYSGKKRFMLHYNFPGFSVGEAKPSRGPGRRDIGHGTLAEKAIIPLLPDKESFPYTIRVVSDILSSNGSSSMATVSASSLSLMDAGVPMKSSAAGIAMGLITDSDGKYKILTDIQGPEDHYGDMDLKIAGTREGVNAIQMDVKIKGITVEILKEAMEQAKKARIHILDFTDSVLGKSRQELSKYAPRILSIHIDPSRIGEVIGPGGKMINGIIERTGVLSIDIDDDGTVFVSADDPIAAENAISEVSAIVKELEVGEIIEGEVVKLLEFGAIVDLGGGKSGLLHVSELKNGFVKNVEDVLSVGDNVRVKVVKMENGKVSLSLKQVEGVK